MIINHNISALNTHRQLGANNNAVSESLEKLSSGLKINRAGDDAAGLAISEKMRGQIRGLEMAQKNAQDGISLIQTAEGALNETHAILQRMRELAVQSSNDTNTPEDREELQKEVNQLANALNDISNDTEFNTQNLLDGNFKATFHVGANSGQNLNVAIEAMGAEALGVSGSGEGVALTEITSSSTSSTLDLKAGDHTLKVVDFGDNVSVGVNGSAAKYGLQDASGNIVAVANSEGKVFNALTEGTKREDLATAIITNSGTDAITFGEAVRSGDVNVTVGAAGAVSATGATAMASIDSEGLATGEYTVKAFDAADFSGVTFGTDTNGDVNDLIDQVILDSNNEVVAVSFKTGETNSIAGAAANEFYSVADIDFSEDTVSSNEYTDVLTSGAEALVTSANLGSTLEVKANGGIDISSQESADAAITTIQSAIDNVSAERSKLGAVQNRLEHTINNLGASAENLTAAESRIRDVDMAKEMMEFTKNNILTQAAQAMLAQANQTPQGVLQLLR